MIASSLRRPGALLKPIRTFLVSTPSCSPSPSPSAIVQHTQRCAFSISTSRLNRNSDPLRILFCGSDAFSCESLKALHKEHVANSGLIEQLEVMVLPGKRTGRGLKQIREVPCKSVAEELGLRVHQRETFRQWNLPNGTNLIIVVSFGLFVPKRILSSAKYGGVNVHPSLLPDLRGPAPIHHALLRGSSHTGISLQTLDATAFDHGTVLAQTPSPGIPIPLSATLSDFRAQLAVQGAEMLVQGLRDGLHVPPVVEAGWKVAELEGTQLMHAPKVDKAAACVEWDVWTAENWKRRINVLDSVWAMAVVGAGKNKGDERRVLFLDAEKVGEEQVEQNSFFITFTDGEKKRYRVEASTDDASGSCSIKLPLGDCVRVRRVKVDGKPEQDAAVALKTFREA